MDNLILGAAYLLVESGRELTPETVASLLADALFPDMSVLGLVQAQKQILPRAKQLLHSGKYFRAAGPRLN
jgi:hypothetical protein